MLGLVPSIGFRSIGQQILLGTRPRTTPSKNETAAEKWPEANPTLLIPVPVTGIQPPRVRAVNDYFENKGVS